MKRIEDRIAYTFKDKELLKVALTHSSHSGTTTNNERLEFLGDAVLELISASICINTTSFPRER